VLLKKSDILHSYAHCWRCKRPVIFRATAQWFISMDKNDLRSKALQEIKKINWVPSWGEERIANMVEGRPDWCISRQRSWGVPIPAFVCKECGSIRADEEITLKVADVFEREGSNAWFKKDCGELLPKGTVCLDCGSSDFEKEYNILDVWFESGASHNILGKKDDLPWPAHVYIEGHDQYRGWFNSSLLIGVGARGGSPYKTCITHGFVLDEQGRGMSKSLGNFIEPGEIIEKNGAEILRLWIAMLNYKEDARWGSETQQRLVEAYRKIRNTWRFILGNIHDFSPDSEVLGLEELLPFDRWILERFRRTGKKIIKAYGSYDFHVVFHAVYNFFSVELSSYYLDVLKDRLYCSGKNEKIRKSAQTTLFFLLRDTLILMAPILPFTTEEAWEVMPGFQDKDESIHLELFPAFDEQWLDDDVFLEWEIINDTREKVLKELEKKREDKTIGNSLEAQITLKVPEKSKPLFLKYEKDLSSLFIVSSVDLVVSEEQEIVIDVSRSSSRKCERCWNYYPYVGTSEEYPEFCKRCEDVVKEISD